MSDHDQRVEDIGAQLYRQHIAQEHEQQPTGGTIYDALIAALEHERACSADYIAGKGSWSAGPLQNRLHDAERLVKELREIIQAQH